MWTVLRLRKALKAEKRAQLTRNEEPHTLRESKGKTASGDLNAPATGWSIFRSKRTGDGWHGFA
ncbi:MAG: hypothetical protein IH991_14800 [Planctomycetes bacterium]|nr:hypothetical protein [Planctomycetota bacterium]